MASRVRHSLLRGVCTIHTSDKAPSDTRVKGTFEVGTQGVQASTATFLDAMEPHSLWDGPIPTCLVERYCGEVRRLRLVLTSQSRLFFSHECRRRVGGVPRSSLKDRKHYIMMGEGTPDHNQKPKSTPKEQTQNTKPRTGHNQKPIKIGSVSSVRE